MMDSDLNDIHILLLQNSNFLQKGQHILEKM